MSSKAPSTSPSIGGAGAPAVSTAESLTGGTGFNQFAAQAEYLNATPGSRAEEFAFNQVRELRTNATSLRKDEWKQLDDRLIQIAQRDLVVVEDLRSRGLTVNTDLSTLIYEWEETDEFGPAEIDMAAETAGRDEDSTFDIRGIPLPIVHKSFRLNFRRLAASRNRGEGLDVTNQAKASRSVMEGLEHMACNGWDGSVRGEQVYGLRTHPDRNNVSAGNWSDRTNVDADAIRNDIIDGIESLEDANYGPEGPGYVFYLNRAAYQELRRRDTGTDKERGLLERLTEEFGDIVEFVRADYLPAGEAVMLKPVEEVIELVVASEPQNVEWESHAGFHTHLKVMASITPMLKSDNDGQMGLSHFTGLSG